MERKHEFIVSFIVALLGLIVAGIGVPFYLAGRQMNEAALIQSPATPHVEELLREAHTLTKIGIACFVIGGLVVVAAVGWFLYASVKRIKALEAEKQQRRQRELSDMKRRALSMSEVFDKHDAEVAERESKRAEENRRDARNRAAERVKLRHRLIELWARGKVYQVLYGYACPEHENDTPEVRLGVVLSQIATALPRDRWETYDDLFGASPYDMLEYAWQTIWDLSMEVEDD